MWVRHFVGYGGDWYFKDWHAERQYTNGLLLQKAAHDIDVLHWLAAGYTRQVQALGDLMVYGDNPHRRAPGEAKHADWYDEDGHWPPHTNGASTRSSTWKTCPSSTCASTTEYSPPTSSATSRPTTGATTRSSVTPAAWRTSETGPEQRYTSGTPAGPSTARSPTPGTRCRTATTTRSRRRGPAARRRIPPVRPRGRRHRHLTGRRPHGRGRRSAGHRVTPQRRYAPRCPRSRPRTRRLLRARPARVDPRQLAQCSHARRVRPPPPGSHDRPQSLRRLSPRPPPSSRHCERRTLTPSPARPSRTSHATCPHQQPGRAPPRRSSR